MKDFFLKLLAYNHQVNKLILPKLAGELPEKGEALKLMAHILNAQQIWLLRLQKKDSSAIAVWGNIEPNKMEETMSQDHDNWKSYLENTDEQALMETLAYTNARGESYTNIAHDIIIHVFNHSTHHRAQISRMMREQAIEPPVTDYIFYMRNS